MHHARHAPARRHDLDYVVGVDLGQARDFTAICIVERVRVFEGEPGEQILQTYLDVRYLARPVLGTPYPAIVRQVIELLDRPPLSRETFLVLDRTGCGRPVVDMFVDAGLRPWAMSIHGGDAAVREGRHLRVPKKELITGLLALYQEGRMRVSEGVGLWETLIAELTSVDMRTNLRTAHDSFEAWREGTHDDLVLSVAMAAWFWVYEAPLHEPLDEATMQHVRGVLDGGISWQEPGWGG